MQTGVVVHLSLSAAALLVFSALFEVQGAEVQAKHYEICKTSNTTIATLMEYIAEKKKIWGQDCNIQLESLKKVNDDLNTFKNELKRLRMKKLPSRQVLEKMSEICDDYITTMKGIIKVMDERFSDGMNCGSDSDAIEVTSKKVYKRIFRCGFGKRGMTLTEAELASLNSKSLVGLRRRRDAEENEDDDELEEMPKEGENGIVGFLKEDTKSLETQNRVAALLKMRGSKLQTGGVQERALIDISVAHKCSCMKSDCKCCLLMYNGNKDDPNVTPWSACLGIEMLNECDRKGVRIYIDVMGFGTEFTILEDSSACYNFDKHGLPVSLCIEPYGFHFCPRRGTFRSCLMLNFEILGFKIASYNMDCVVLSYTKEGGIGLRLRKSKDKWLPQLGIINILFNWISDLIVSQYGTYSEKK